MKKRVVYGLFLSVDLLLALWLYGAAAGEQMFAFTYEIIITLQISGFLLSCGALMLALAPLSRSVRDERMEELSWVDASIATLALGTAFPLACLALVPFGLPDAVFVDVAQYGFLIWVLGALALVWRTTDYLCIESIRGLKRARMILSSR